jgi:hypothetical protein
MLCLRRCTVPVPRPTSLAVLSTPVPLASSRRAASSFPDTATADDIRRFQLHLIEAGHSICNRNRIMTGVRFLFRVTLRRHDLAAEIYHLK